MDAELNDGVQAAILSLKDGDALIIYTPDDAEQKLGAQYPAYYAQLGHLARQLVDRMGRQRIAIAVMPNSLTVAGCGNNAERLVQPAKTILTAVAVTLGETQSEDGPTEAQVGRAAGLISFGLAAAEMRAYGSVYDFAKAGGVPDDLPLMQWLKPLAGR